jgi:hypothetical protein
LCVFLGMEPRASCMLDKRSLTDYNLSTLAPHFLSRGLVKL